MREYVFLECTECSDRNYRTPVNVTGGAPKLERMKYCKRQRKRTLHKIRRK
jgi:large subunit ribosomal protein L33